MELPLALEMKPTHISGSGMMGRAQEKLPNAILRTNSTNNHCFLGSQSPGFYFRVFKIKFLLELPIKWNVALVLFCFSLPKNDESREILHNVVILNT